MEYYGKYAFRILALRMAEIFHLKKKKEKAIESGSSMYSNFQGVKTTPLASGVNLNPYSVFFWGGEGGQSVFSFV